MILKGYDIVKNLKGSARSRQKINMKDNINDKKIDSYDDLPKSVKNTHTDDPLDDLISANCDGKGEDVSVYKLSSEAAKNMLTTSL